MSRARWRDQIGPPVIMLGSALLTAALPVASLAVGSGLPPVACPAARDAVQARDRHAAAGRTAPRLDAVLSAVGELTGQTLVLDTLRGSKSLTLPAESFAGQPTGDLLVYTTDYPATGSAVHLVDLANGCDTVAVAPHGVVRSAVVVRDGSALYVHSVTRAGRRDNGVARVDLATGATRTVVPPIAPSAEIGPTFATSLNWSVNGIALAVQSCGFTACRTRVFDPATGNVATFDQPGQGALITLTSDHLVTYGDCLGLPCNVVSADLDSGESTVLADRVWSVSTSPQSDGSAGLSIETAAGTIEVVQ